MYAFAASLAGYPRQDARAPMDHRAPTRPTVTGGYLERPAPSGLADVIEIILDKGTNPNQAQFFPYLAGYVAYYAGDYKNALVELQKANQNDPFILLLMAQSYEKIGDEAQAKTLYEKILTFNTHNPPNAFARPIAKKKVGKAS